MQSLTIGTKRRLLAAMLVVGGVALALLISSVTAAFAGTSTSVQWRNEGYSAATGWTTGMIGPYDEGALVPFRLTVTNPSNTKSAVVGGFSLQVTREAHGVSVFDYTTNWSGPISASLQDGVADDMLRTTFPAGMTLGPSQSVTFTFFGHLAVSTLARPAAGMLNGNGVCGFSQVDAAGVGGAGKSVPVKVNPRPGLLGTPAIDLAKSSDAPTSGVKAGTTVTYSYLVTNIGDVPLVNAVITDDVLGTIGTIAGPLAPGASQTLTASAVLRETTTANSKVAATDEFGREATDESALTVSVFATARIFGSMFWDWDNNGSWDALETGLAGWAIELQDAQGNVVATVLTDENGAYSFDGVEPGTAYTVRALVPSSWYQTAPIGSVYTVTPASGQDAGPFDFGAVFVGET
jgi:uncharacterized repeat protein (TIGR01451 family)